MRDVRRAHVAGTAYGVGGLLWFVLGATQTALWGFEPPPGSMAFNMVEMTFVVAQLLLLFGCFGLLWSGAVGRGAGMFAFGLAALGHLLFVAAEAHSLALGTLSDLLAIAAVVSATGFVLTGFAVLTTKQWQGWTRWVPLLTGLYFWVVMFPFILVADEPNGYAVAGWGLVRLVLGLAMRAQAAAPATIVNPAAAVARRRVY